MKKTTKNTANTTANTAAAQVEEAKTTAAPAKAEAAKKEPTLTERRQALRRELSALSLQLKAQHPEEKSVNRLLLAHYAKKLGCEVFKSWKAWEAEGRHIRRGQHAVTIWRPATDNGKARYLMQFLFAETQTYQRKEAAPAAPEATEARAAAVATA